MSRGAVERTIEAVWHMDSAKIIGKLARMLGNVGLAEEIAQDAWVAALEQWADAGLPENPGAWLMATAKNKAVDQLRRRQLQERTSAVMAHDSALVGGLTVAEIARAFLTSEAAIQQRIVRAKRTLHEAHVPFDVPGAAERAQRLASVLDVIYLIFNEGYAATAGADWMRPALCEDALRVGRILAEIDPTAPEVHGLVALMELQASRTAARVTAAGEPILLAQQNRALWDQLLIGRGLAALARAESFGGPLGPYTLQGAIAACHARARTLAETDWPRIVALYDALNQVQPSPVVALNRAVAVSMAYGPAAALDIVDSLRNESRLREYHLLPSVRGDLLEKLGRLDEARAEFAHAASLTQNARERDLLLLRAADCRTDNRRPN